MSNKRIPDGCYTILNFFARNVLQPRGGESTAGTYIVGTAPTKSWSQLWDITYDSPKKLYVFKNVGTATYASSRQVGLDVGGHPILQLSDTIEYFKLTPGTYCGSYFITPGNMDPLVLDLYQSIPDDNTPVIMNAKNTDRTPPPSIEGNANQQWCFIAVPVKPRGLEEEEADA